MSRPQSISIHWFVVLSIAVFQISLGSRSVLAVDQNSETDQQSSSEADPGSGELLEGHSAHGEIFNEGPRQAAFLMEGTGEVDFPVTAASEQARQFFLQGVGQLHGFWYFESERSFRQAAALDPNCAMAYWGMAMSNRKNVDRARGFIQEAKDRMDKVTGYEQKWIKAFDKYINKDAKSDEEKRKRATEYVSSLEEILSDFPHDLEAKAFLAEFLWSAQREKLPIVSYHAVDAMIQDVLLVQPNHPIHHYKIHLWDRKKAAIALKSAAECGPSAPSIAHMWHMPGHIYSKLHRYHDAVFQQEASARVDHGHMQRDLVLPDQIHNFAHNNEWCIRNLLHVGRVSDALSLSKNMIELPQHPKYNSVKKSGSFKYGRDRLVLTLSTYQLFEETVRLSTTPYLEPVEDFKIDLKADRLVASAMVMTGESALATKRLQQIQGQWDEREKKKSAAAETARDKATQEKKDKGQIAKAVSAAEKPFNNELKQLQAALDEVNGRVLLVKGEFEEALALLKKPGVLPPEELVDVMLKAGKTKEAVQKIEEIVRTNQNEVRPLACLVDTYWRAGEKEKAAKAFSDLQKISASIDRHVQAFARLAVVANHVGIAGDWRQPLAVMTDQGQRPSLDDLGPFRWAPVKASDFQLVDSDKQVRSLADYKGKPVVVIFYLGHGCLHCAEQLQKFAPAAKKFQDAGFELIAVSTDKQETLSRAYEDLDEKFPFPLVADPKLSTFKEYRCFDDFEDQSLHGTFVVDGQQRIRWMDISYEPFMDPDFVLKEAIRLIGQDAVTKELPEMTQKGIGVEDIGAEE
ncbi:MAG: redoxin domain-containing protein [Fuerstiella sp.]